jgi:hypothetical protein
MQIVEPKEPLMLELPVGSHGKFVDEEAAKAIDDVVIDDDISPTTPTEWNDDVTNGIDPIED